MSRRELLAYACIGVALAALLMYALYGGYPLRSPVQGVGAQESVFAADRGLAAPRVSARPTALPTYSASGIRSTAPIKPTPLPTATLLPLEPAPLPGPDDADLLFLHVGASGSMLHGVVRGLSAFLGVRSVALDLGGAALTADPLRDEGGRPYPLVIVDARSVLDAGSQVAPEVLATLRTEVAAGGTHLLLAKADGGVDAEALAYLTDGAIVGVAAAEEHPARWRLSDAAPEVWRELSGETIDGAPATVRDGALVLGEGSAATVLVYGADAAGLEHPVAASAPVGSGAVTVDAGAFGDHVATLSLGLLYYRAEHFTDVTPLLAVMRYALGEEAWHNDRNYANLTIDDPALVEPFQSLSYPGLLAEMQAHDYHTTIAYVPANWSTSERAVSDLFRVHPDRFSLAVHGNNHDGYEFYHYAEDGPDDEHRARPLEEQRANIAQALERMDQHRRATGVAYDPVMVFPYGVCPEQTLVSLKEHNYLATVNGNATPLDASSPDRWDFGMYPASLDYAGFPLLQRRHPGEYPLVEPDLARFLLDLFIDKPALFYSHTYELFEDRIGAFDVVADRLNALPGGVEWRSLGDILRNLYLEKTDDNGETSVMAFTNDTTIVNRGDATRAYHIRRVEVQNVPIARVTVNGFAFPYRVEDGLLRVDVIIPAGESARLRIEYGAPVA